MTDRRCRMRTAGLTLAVAAAAAVPASPAQAEGARVTCERIPGKTLAASAEVRVFVARATAGNETAISVCRPGSRVFERLAYGKRATKAAQVAVRGRWAAVADLNLITGAGSARKDDGVAWSTVWFYDAKTGRTRYSDRLNGRSVRELVITQKGLVGAIADPFGIALGAEGQPNAPQTTSGVFAMDPRSGRLAAVRSLAEAAAPTVLSGLAASGDLFVWQRDGALQSSARN